jgi:hypothetical protein
MRAAEQGGPARKEDVTVFDADHDARVDLALPPVTGQRKEDAKTGYRAFNNRWESMVTFGQAGSTLSCREVRLPFVLRTNGDSINSAYFLWSHGIDQHIGLRMTIIKYPTRTI